MVSHNPQARLTDLYQRHHREVLAYCARRVGPSDAEDVAADVFALAWRKIDEFHSETARALLYGLARGVLANRWRATQRRLRLVRRVGGLATVGPLQPDDQVVRRAEDRVVVAALQSLKALDREALTLSAWEGLSAPQIATALNISVSAAEQRLHRAKGRFAALLERTVPDISPALHTREEPADAG